MVRLRGHLGTLSTPDGMQVGRGGWGRLALRAAERAVGCTLPTAKAIARPLRVGWSNEGTVRRAAAFRTHTARQPISLVLLQLLSEQGSTCRPILQTRKLWSQEAQ